MGCTEVTTHILLKTCCKETVFDCLFLRFSPLDGARWWSCTCVWPVVTVGFRNVHIKLSCYKQNVRAADPQLNPPDRSGWKRHKIAKSCEITTSVTDCDSKIKAFWWLAIGASFIMKRLNRIRRCCCSQLDKQTSCPCDVCIRSVACTICGLERFVFLLPQHRQTPGGVWHSLPLNRFFLSTNKADFKRVFWCSVSSSRTHPDSSQ